MLVCRLLLARACVGLTRESFVYTAHSVQQSSSTFFLRSYFKVDAKNLTRDSSVDYNRLHTTSRINLQCFGITRDVR